jgi:hypothetical protein
VGALSDPAQFGLAHRSLEPEEEAIVELAQIIDALGVDDEGVHQAAEVQELIPVAIVAGQVRDFESHHGPGAAQTDFSHEPLKARATGGTRARLAKVVINDHDLAPAHRAGVIGQVVLPAAAFGVMANLIESGLPDVNEGGPGEMLRTNLFTRPHGLPPAPWPRRPRLGAGARQAARARARGGRDAGRSSHPIASVHSMANWLSVVFCLRMAPSLLCHENRVGSECFTRCVGHEALEEPPEIEQRLERDLGVAHQFQMGAPLARRHPLRDDCPGAIGSDT